MILLYRLDYADSGSIDPAILSCHMTTARAAATERAQMEGRAILITRIAAGGATRACLVIAPNGRAHVPGGMRGDPCVASEGRTCFCRNCRASRRQ